MVADNSSTQIDYAFYDALPIFTAEVAACLWTNVDPAERYGQMPPLVKNMVLLFERKIGSHIHHLGITRKELYRLADDMNVHPVFLFHGDHGDNEYD